MVVKRFKQIQDYRISFSIIIKLKLEISCKEGKSATLLFSFLPSTA